MSHFILTRSASEGTTYGPRLRFGLVSFPAARSSGTSSRSIGDFQARVDGLQDCRAVGLHVIPAVADPVDLLRAQGQIGQEQHVIAHAERDFVRHVVGGIDPHAAQERQLVATAREAAAIGRGVVVRGAVGLDNVPWAKLSKTPAFKMAPRSRRLYSSRSPSRTTWAPLSSFRVLAVWVKNNWLGVPVPPLLIPSVKPSPAAGKEGQVAAGGGREDGVGKAHRGSAGVAGAESARQAHPGVVVEVGVDVANSQPQTVAEEAGRGTRRLRRWPRSCRSRCANRP